MRRVFLYMTLTFDGYLSGPNNELDWFRPPSDPELIDDVVAIIASADTGIMGYPTGPGLISYWKGIAKDPSATSGDRAIAQAINQMHTVVLSNTELELGIENAKLALVRNDQDLVDLITRLKRMPGKDIGVPGGVRTGQKFARLGLVDEYILMVHPIAIGKGKPLFTSWVNLDLIWVKPYKSGVLQIRYRPRNHD